MHKLSILFGIVFVALFTLVPPAMASPCGPDNEAPGIYVPDQGCFSIGVGYLFQHFSVLGTSFHNHTYNANVTMHLFDWLTGAEGRLTVAAEVAVNGGFGGRTTGSPSLDAKSLFVGGGPHLAIPSRSRFQPWAHGLVGLERLRFTQTSTLGANSTLGFIVGGGVDIRFAPRAYWRVEGNYVGTTFQGSIQSNYSAGTGVLFYF